MFAALNPTVNVIGLGLVVIGLALLVATLAFWRSAIEDPEVLAPLEMMGERRFSKANDFERFEILNDVRPGGPMPVRITTAPPLPQDVPARRPARRSRANVADEMFATDVDVDEPVVDHDDWGDHDVEVPDHDSATSQVIDPLLQFQNKRTRD